MDPAYPAPAPVRASRDVLIAYGGIMLTILLAALDQTIVATALPQIVGDLEGFEQLSWIITAYLIASTVTVPVYGKLSDLFGRRPLFVVAIGIFVAGSVLCGLAQTMGQLIAFRALQGVGAGGLIPLSLAAVADLFPPRERGRYQGYIGATWATAAIAGPLVGGTLTDTASWRWIFLVNLPLGLLALVVVVRTMPAPGARGTARIDYAAAALLTSAVTLVLLAVAWGGAEHPWLSAPVLGAAGAGAALGVAFVRRSRRAPEPLLPLDLLRGRVFAVCTSATFVVGAVLFAVTVYVPVFMQGVLGGTATASGLALIPLSVGWVGTSVVAGQIVARTGRYRAFPIVGGVLVVVGTVLLAGIDAGTSQGEISRNLLIVGAGMGMTFQTYIVAAQNAVPAAQVGTATAAIQFFRSMGASLAVAALGAVLTGRVVAALADRVGPAAGRVDLDRLLQGDTASAGALAPDATAALASGLQGVFLAVVPFAVCGALLAFALEERPLATHQPAPGEPGAVPADA